MDSFKLVHKVQWIDSYLRGRNSETCIILNVDDTTEKGEEKVWYSSHAMTYIESLKQAIRHDKYGLENRPFLWPASWLKTPHQLANLLHNFLTQNKSLGIINHTLSDQGSQSSVVWTLVYDTGFARKQAKWTIPVVPTWWGDKNMVPKQGNGQRWRQMHVKFTLLTEKFSPW